MRLSFSTLGCPSWSLARVLDAAGRPRLRRRRAPVPRGRRRAVGTAGALGLGSRRDDAPARRRGPRGPLRRHALLLPSPRPRARAAPPSTRPRGRRRWRRPSAPRASACSAIGCSQAPTSPRPAAGSPSRSRRCATACAARGVEVWLETHGDFATATAARSLLEQAGGEGLGLVWDPANAFSEFGEQPEAAAVALGPFVCHVHLKDVRRPVDGQVRWPPALPGRGDFPAARVLEWLMRAGGTAGCRSSGRSAGTRRSRSRRSRCRASSAGPRTSCAGGAPQSARAARVLACGRLRVEVFPSRPIDGARRGPHRRRGHPQPPRARGAGRRHLRFRALPERVPRRAAAGARDRLAEAAPPFISTVRRHRPPTTRLLPRFLVDRLFDRVGSQHSTASTDEAKVLGEECARFAALLRRQPPALTVLGIGENGHLAFIDPPVCDFAERADVRVVELDEPCRRQQVNDGCFPQPRRGPAHGALPHRSIVDGGAAGRGHRPRPGQASRDRGRGPGPGHDRLPRVDPASAPRRHALPRRGLGRRARRREGLLKVTGVTADSSRRTSF